MAPIERSTYKDHVIKYIYDGMRENRFRPGEKILESHLAKELGISRAPIREALADLVRSGLLEYRPQVGNFVAALSPEEIVKKVCPSTPLPSCHSLADSFQPCARVRFNPSQACAASLWRTLSVSLS